MVWVLKAQSDITLDGIKHMPVEREAQLDSVLGFLAGSRRKFCNQPLGEDARCSNAQKLTMQARSCPKGGVDNVTDCILEPSRTATIPRAISKRLLVA